MATGNPNDFVQRLRGLIPRGWIAEFSLVGNFVAYVSNAVLGGLADSLAWAFNQLIGAKLATRRATLTGWLLDLDAFAFLGSSVLRRPGESDDDWRSRYTAEIFRPRVTRPAIIQALTDLTGRAPVLVELWNSGDCGGYGTSALAYAGGIPVAPRVTGYGDTIGGYGSGRIGYGVRSQVAGVFSGAGRYGSLNFPFQIFISAFRPQRPTIGGRSGYGSPQGGYGSGSAAYADLSEVQSIVSDSEIFACVARTVAAGITAWVNISD